GVDGGGLIHGVVGKRIPSSTLRRSPEIRKSTRRTRTPPLTVIARSPCDEAIQGPRAVAPGLLRCARNDGGVDATIIGHRLNRAGAARRRNDRPRVLFRNEDALLA